MTRHSSCSHQKNGQKCPRNNHLASFNKVVSNFLAHYSQNPKTGSRIIKLSWQFKDWFYRVEISISQSDFREFEDKSRCFEGCLFEKNTSLMSPQFFCFYFQLQLSIFFRLSLWALGFRVYYLFKFF